MSDHVRIEVDRATCVGSGTCAGLAPDHFELGDDGLAHAIRSVAEDDESLREAADCCPVQAILVSSAASGS